ncbi:hypothetical protein TNCV_2748781 [Trichonephila clavipes]|nr:hypothetical protein TNCV_2748781 [Trichonephila clavipes]
MPRETVTSKNDKKTHFVSTARTSVTRHVILNVPNSPNPKKKALPFPTRLKEKIFQANGLKEEFPSLTLLAEKSPIRSSKTENLTANKKEDSSSGFLTQDNNSSDFSQVLELFNTISNLVKNNPKILDLLSKFKTANSEEEKPAFWQKL